MISVTKLLDLTADNLLSDTELVRLCHKNISELINS